MEIDTGDTVKHLPTGEEWLVAVVDGERLSWCGWPEGWAKVADCELVRKAEPMERTTTLIAMAHMGNESDHRCRYARKALASRGAS